jgi:DNA-binding GntR family transcriptional regulator
MSDDSKEKRKASPIDVYAFLREEILSQKLAPGASLFERAIAKQHGVSRTPVREALHRLEAEGLARRYPKMGMVVTELTLRDVNEAFQIRRFIEPPAAAEAALILPLEPLRVMLAEFKSLETAKLSDDERFARHNLLDSKMHYLILGSLGNGRLIELMNNLRGICSRVRSFGTPIRFTQSTQEHTAVLKALLDRDAAKAETAMREHLDNTRHRLMLAV